MTDVFLGQGQASPADVKLTDPTQTGAVTVTGTAAGVTGAPVGAASAVHGVSGSAAGVTSAPTGSAAGVHGVSANAAGLTVTPIGTAAAVHGVSSTASGVTSDATGSAVGTFAGGITGAADGVTADATGSAAGIVAVSGSAAAVTLAPTGSATDGVATSNTGGGGGRSWISHLDQEQEYRPAKPARKPSVVATAKGRTAAPKANAIAAVGAQAHAAAITASPIAAATAAVGIAGHGNAITRKVVAYVRGEQGVAGTADGLAPIAGRGGATEGPTGASVSVIGVTAIAAATTQQPSASSDGRYEQFSDAELLEILLLAA